MRQNLNDFFIHHFMSQFFSAANARESERLLDLGCGTAPYSRWYANGRRWVAAIDVEHRGGALTALASAMALPFPSNTFDTVVCSEVIEHVPDANQTLAEIARVLRPGGRLLLTWPLHYSLHEIPTDFRRPTEFGMVAMLDANGLELVEIHRRGDVFGVLLVICGHLFQAAAYAPTRLPLLGRAFWPAHWLAVQFSTVLEYTYFLLFRGTRRLSGYSARGSTGAASFLVSWCLGYCAIAHKQKVPNA